MTETDKKESKTVVVVNTQPRLMILRARKGLGGPGYEDGKWLMPGENDVDKRFWDASRKTEGVKTQLALGNLVDKGEGEAKGLVDSLGSLTVGETGKYISAEKDVATLMKWRDADSRSTVKKACDAKINKLIDEQGGGVEA